MSKILVVGELNPDFILQGYESFPVPGKEVLVDDFSMTLGSASAICAMGLTRLGNSVSFLGKIGDDLLGGFCLQILERAGLDVSNVVRDSKLKTGVTVSITSPSDRALLTFLGAMVALREDEIPDELLKEFQHLHMSSYFLQQALRPRCRRLFARAHRLGVTTSLDPGYDPKEQWGKDLHETLRETDVFFPNEVEAFAITGYEEPLAALQRLQNGRTHIVMKLGSKGCVTLEQGQLVRCPAFPVDPVDTTGAGDSFNAGFLHAWLSGSSICESLRIGAACGAMSTLGLGGTSAQPDAEQLTQFLQNSSDIP